MRYSERLEQLRASRSPEMLAEMIPFAKFMHIDFTADKQMLVATMRRSEKVIGDPQLRVLHGGTVSALLELTAQTTLVWQEAVFPRGGGQPSVIGQRDADFFPKTITFAMDFLKPTLDAPTYASARVSTMGTRVARMDSWAWQDDPDDPVARARVNLLVL